MPTQSSAATATAASTRTAERAKQPWLWNVVLLNDDEHSYDYVITMLKTVFAHPEPRGMQIAKRVDKHGRAVVLTTHKEHAELKLDQIHAFGRDELIAACVGSMSAIIEPAEFEADDASNDHTSEQRPSV